MGNVDSAPVDEKATTGFRVLLVQDGAPGARSGLVSYFDFIMAANGVALETLDNTFADIVGECEERPLSLTVYNTKKNEMRELVVVPSRSWDSTGGGSLLGITVRFDSHFEAEEHVLHVLEVLGNSPSAIAGLQASTDYLLGTAQRSFRDPEDLAEVVEAHLDKPVEFFVYNVERDDVRTVVIMPSLHWGGEGSLGCNVGHGYLHRVPQTATHTVGKSNAASAELFQGISAMGATPLVDAAATTTATVQSADQLPMPPAATPQPIHGDETAMSAARPLPPSIDTTSMYPPPPAGPKDPSRVDTCMGKGTIMSIRSKDEVVQVALDWTMARQSTAIAYLQPSGIIATTSVDVIHEEVRQFYNTHNKEKLKDLPGLFAKFKGKEQILLYCLHKKYSLLPPVVR